MAQSAEFDALGLPVDCGEPHPVTGNGCVEPRGHDGLHHAMGAVRMQGFGAEATCPIPPGLSAQPSPASPDTEGGAEE